MPTMAFLVGSSPAARTRCVFVFLHYELVMYVGIKAKSLRIERVISGPQWPGPKKKLSKLRVSLPYLENAADPKFFSP